MYISELSLHQMNSKALKVGSWQFADQTLSSTLTVCLPRNIASELWNPHISTIKHTCSQGHTVIYFIFLVFAKEIIFTLTGQW